MKTSFIKKEKRIEPEIDIADAFNFPNADTPQHPCL
jgi:hypothetical protein